MTIENGADQAPNDNALPTATEAINAAENTEQTEGEEGAEEKPSEDEVELDIDGEKFRLPRKVKEAIAKPFQSDYSRKTEELSNQRRAFETERQTVQQQDKAHREAEIKIAVLDNTLAQYDVEIAKAWAEQDQARATQLIWNQNQFRTQREEANRDLSQKDGERQERVNRETGERQSKVVAEIAKHLPEWTPGGELDVKLAQYGTSRGFTPVELASLANLSPRLVAEFNRYRLMDEAAKKQKTQQTFDKTQQAQPVTRVGGAGGTATQRKTTDSSGDALSAEEWNRRENERNAKQRVRR